MKEAEETRSKYRHYRSDYEQATVNGNEEEAAKAMGKMQEIMRSEDFLRMRTVEAYDRQIQKVRQIVNMYDDRETKRKYGEMLKDMEEQLLRQIEASEIKK